MVHKKILNNLLFRKTIDLCQKLDSIGCSYLTVHARTRFERHEPVHLDLLELVVQHAKNMPVVANGDLFTLGDCKRVCEQTKTRGVMCARGLLSNPALFAGYENTPIKCVKDWVEICLETGASFTYFHQVLTQMLQNVLLKSERRYLYSLTSTTSVIDYLNENIFS